MIQLGRGCLRRCEFCTVSRRPFWFPPEIVMRSVRASARAGPGHVQLISEDVLLYGSRNLRPDGGKFHRLLDAVSKEARFISLSHFSVSSVNQRPDLFTELDAHLPEGQDFVIAQTGIETGSERLLGKVARAKKRPYRDVPWRDMILNMADTLDDSVVFPYYTLLVGCPHSTPDDIGKTIDLVREIFHRKSLLMPCLYTTCGAPHREVEALADLEKELISLCFSHNLKWYNRLLDNIVGLLPHNPFGYRNMRRIAYWLGELRLRGRFREMGCGAGVLTG
jgi:hypothetical protein